MEKLGIIIVVESGDLEQKAKLLIDSIRTFGGGVKDSKIWTVKPRKGKALREATLKFLQDKGVELIDVDLNKHWRLYGLANKIYATAYIEENYGHLYETLLFLDSDTVVIDHIDIDILEGKYEVSIKPEDGDLFSLKEESRSFWEMIFKACEVNQSNIWTVRTAVTQVEVAAYFNSGVIFSSARSKLFSQWLKNFKNIVKNQKAYHLPYRGYYFLEQALLTGTILNLFTKDEIKILNNEYNYPLNFQKELEEKGLYKNCPIKILHYHKLFRNEWAEDIAILPLRTRSWLKQYLPLKMYEQNPFQKKYTVFRYIVWRLRNSISIRLLVWKNRK